MTPERDGLHGVHHEARSFALPPAAVHAALGTLLVEALGQDLRSTVERPRTIDGGTVFVVESRSLFGCVRLSVATTLRDAGELRVEATAENVDSPLVLLSALAFAVATAGTGLLVLALFSAPLARERTRRREAMVRTIFEALESLERAPHGSYRTSAYALRD